jgi:hypothetical protein
MAQGAKAGKLKSFNLHILITGSKFETHIEKASGK